MKKLLKGIATLIAFVVILFGATQTVRAENADRAHNKEARAITIKGVDEEGYAVPLNSYNSEFTVYLLPGEKWTMEIPNVPGYTPVKETAKNLISKTTYDLDPNDVLNIEYDAIPAQDTLFSGGGASGDIKPSWEVTIHFQLNEGATKFYGVPVHADESFSTGDTKNDTFSRYSNRNMSNYPFEDYVVYIRDGETFPLKSRTKDATTFHGFFYMKASYGGGTSDVFTTNQVIDLSQHDFGSFGLNTEIIAMYGNNDKSTADISDGYWEAFPFASIPGNEDYINGVEVPGGAAAQEPVEEEEEVEETTAEEYVEEDESSTAKQDSTIVVLAICAAIALVSIWLIKLMLFTKKKD